MNHPVEQHEEGACFPMSPKEIGFSLTAMPGFLDAELGFSYDDAPDSLKERGDFQLGVDEGNSRRRFGQQAFAIVASAERIQRGQA